MSDTPTTNKRASLKRASVTINNPIALQKEIETEESKLKRFEELTRNIRSGTNESSTKSLSSIEVDEDSVNKRRSFTVKVAEKMGLSKRHTVSLATSDIRDLAKALDKNGKRVFKMGQMQKRSDILKKWKPRFFVVREDKFCWFKTIEAFQDGKSPEGSMVYKDALVDKEDEVEMGRQWVFSFNSRGKGCFVGAKDEEEMVEWMTALKKTVKGEFM